MRDSMRMRVVAVAVLSGLLVLNGGLYVFLASRGRIPDPGAFFVLAAICLVAGAAVLFAVLSKARLDMKTRRLDPRYKPEYDAVHFILSLSPLTVREKRDLYDEVLDLFLSAQADGKEPGAITGKDPADFAKGVLAAFGAEKPAGAGWLPESIMYFIGFAAGTQALLSLESPGAPGGFFASGPDHSMLIFFLLVSPCAPLMRALAKRLMAGGRIGLSLYLPLLVLPLALAGLFIAAMEILRAGAESWPSVMAFLDGTTPVFPNPVALGMGAALFAGAWALRRRLGSGSGGKARVG